MSRLCLIFNQTQQQNRCAFLPFITAGDSGLDNSLMIMQSLVENGADIIELGMPFSDPMADGKIIQRSNERAIKAGICLQDVLNLVAKFRQTNTKTGVVLMGYANPIEKFGYQNFAKQAVKAGVDGVLVVDIPPEESQHLKEVLNAQEIDLIFLVSPTTTNKRLQLLATQVSGFVYFVALKGVSGAGNFNAQDVASQLVRIRQYIKLPIGVGFGIKDAPTAQSIAMVADGVIIGSALVKLVGQYSNDKKTMLAQVGQLSSKISGVLNKK